MYDEVKTFVAAMDAAKEQYRNAPPKTPGGPHNELTCPLCAREVSEGVAWDALKASTDPLVRWIAENVDEYKRHATKILEALPASMAELDKIADAHNWCGDWEFFKAAAEKAGVLPVDAEVSA